MTNIAAAVASGDRVRALTALRDRLAEEIDGDETRPGPKELAALVLRLQSVLSELAAMSTEGSSRIDDLARARANRRATSANV